MGGGGSMAAPDLGGPTDGASLAAAGLGGASRAVADLGGAAGSGSVAADGLGDHMDWNDGCTTIVCKLFAEQVRKGNRPNTHLNNVGYFEVKERFFQSTGIMLKKSQLKNKWDKLRGDLSAWNKLMRKQIGTGWNWEKGTINMDAKWWKKTKKDIPGMGKFKNRPLQNEDELKVMFGNIINEEQDHWNPMSSNLIIPPSQEAPNPMSSNFNDAEDGLEMGGNNDLDNGDEVQEVSPSVANAKKKVHVILDKPNKKHKASTALVIQEQISKISDNASSFVASRQAGITIEQVMDHVAACGAACGSDEHFVATELFVKKEQREMFMTIPTNEARFSWLNRKYDMMFAK
uniref:Myb/SANT-like domain-containing protein n=1 Tax=Setaria viridis TaxID=4556 RepID=A0A4U6TB02_SETVI|nr:hypothetical protein SEVIR_9G280400v2 [Setaria viridis]